MEYYNNTKIKPMSGDTKISKGYLGDYLFYISSVYLSYTSGQSSATIEVEEDTDVNNISETETCTHSNAVTHQENYTYTCNGYYHWGQYGQPNAEGVRTRVNQCNNCGAQAGYENQMFDEGTQSWVTTSTWGNTTTGWQCTNQLTGTRTVTDCPANTVHGSAKIQVTGSTTLSIDADVTITAYEWKKGNTVIGTGATCQLNGDGTYSCTITWQDSNRTSVTHTTTISTTITITD